MNKNLIHIAAEVLVISNYNRYLDATFIFISQGNFEAEFSDFNGELEDIFELCTPCLLTVNREIDRQDRILAPGLMAHRLDQKRRDKRRWVKKN